ncbi:MAG TPA: GTPase Era [Pseudomonadales bacterium]|nr:GTPase Era [Pseudomonadales bacterium]
MSTNDSSDDAGAEGGTAGTGAAAPRCGYVAFVGRPNVGKSTLLNRLVGQKVSITSSRPQTTRHTLLGIHTEGADQIIYVDTPGLHSAEKRALNRAMNRSARAALADVDVACMLVEAGRWTEADDMVLGLLGQARGARFLIINKADRMVPRQRLLPFMEACSKRAAFDEIIPLSALNGENLEALTDCIRARLPHAPHLFGDDAFTDRSERFLVAETIREKIMRRVGDELPHQITVTIEQWTQEPRVLVIHANILVEREGQRAIVIGHGGERLKQVGIDARRDIEELLGTHVRLELWVKVRGGWSDNESMLRNLGFTE